jgi:hypothetical protein
MAHEPSPNTAVAQAERKQATVAKEKADQEDAATTATCATADAQACVSVTLTILNAECADTTALKWGVAASYDHIAPTRPDGDGSVDDTGDDNART